MTIMEPKRVPAGRLAAGHVSPIAPSTQMELQLLARGCRWVAGLDEVGRGSLAGPVVAAAVVLPSAVLRQPAELAEVRDSKMLTPLARTRLAQTIRQQAAALGIGIVSAPDIDRYGIAPCTRMAMQQAVAELSIRPDFALVDFITLPDLDLPHYGVVDGDALCLSIAAASVVAKVARDRLMEQQDLIYPDYGFARHKGYCTATHLEALQAAGPCELHRRSFAPVRDVLGEEMAGAMPADVEVWGDGDAE